MGSSSERELEEQLEEAGNSLLNLPSSIDQLLNLLDKVEHLLANVEQAPSRSMQDALLPSMKALIANELLRHPVMDVKVSVASCFNEITRITAPDAPYDDEQMKEIFELIVAAFENLSHESNPCYKKAVSILDTVAKVRSCLVMLDLECDALIIEMFQRFLKIIRPDHPHTVFSAMESIMTLVLDESEDISLGLLSHLLASVRKENENFSLISWKLGEKVITNCAVKLKPSLMEAVQSTGIALDNYAPIVTFICQNQSDTIERDHVKGSGEHMEDENKSAKCTESEEPSQVTKGLAPDTICPTEVRQAVDGSSKSTMSNGTALIGNDNTISENSSKKLERCCLAKHSKSIDARGSAEPDDLASMKTVKSETETEIVPKKRGRKPNSLMNPEEGYDHSWICAERKSLKLARRRKSHDKEILPSENPVSKKAALPSTHENVSEPLGCSPKIGEIIGAASPSTNDSLPDGSHRKRGRPKKKERLMSQDADPNSLSVSKGVFLNAYVQGKAVQHADINMRKEPEDTSNLESKPQRRSRKIELAAKTCGKATLAPGYVVSEKETENPGDPGEKPLEQSVTKVAVGNVREDRSPVQTNIKRKGPEDTSNLESKPQRCSRKIELAAKTSGEATLSAGYVVSKKETENPGDPGENPRQQSVTNVAVGNVREDRSPVQTNIKISSAYATSGKDITDASGNKEMISKHATKSSNIVESYLEETPKSKPKRGRPTKKEQVSDMPDLDERLVGSRIKVWWPMDKRFYEGVVDSFDPFKKKHKVLYVDGDQEILNLKKQRWELIGHDVLLDGGQETDLPNPDASLDLLQNGKGKTKSGSAKQAKVDSSSKRGGASASISKLEAIKSGGISAEGLMLDKAIVVDESMDGTSRTNDRLKDDGQKSTKKLKVKELKTSMQTTPETVTESKAESPRGGSDSHGTGRVKGEFINHLAEMSKGVKIGGC